MLSSEKSVAGVALRRRLQTSASLVVLLLSMVLLPHGSKSQTGGGSLADPGIQLPQRVLYGEFFKQIVLLDNEGDLADKRGAKGAEFRNYHQIRAGLTPQEAAVLRDCAHEALNAAGEVQEKIDTGIVIFRQQFNDSRAWPAGQPLPPPPAEILALQAQKYAIFLDSISKLQSRLGPTRFGILDRYVHATIAPHITVTPVNSPSSVRSRTSPASTGK